MPQVARSIACGFVECANTDRQLDSGRPLTKTGNTWFDVTMKQADPSASGISGLLCYHHIPKARESTSLRNGQTMRLRNGVEQGSLNSTIYAYLANPMLISQTTFRQSIITRMTTKLDGCWPNKSGRPPLMRANGG